MGSSLCSAQSSDMPSVGLTVRLVTCTDARNPLTGHTCHKEISTFFHIAGFMSAFVSWMKASWHKTVDS